MKENEKRTMSENKKQDRQLKKSSRRLKIAFITLLIIVAPLVIYRFFWDYYPYDDTELRYERPDIPDEENGYQELVKGRACYLENIIKPDDLIEIDRELKNREETLNQYERIEVCIAHVKRALEYPYMRIVPPEEYWENVDEVRHNLNTFYRHVVINKAWIDAKNGDSEMALEEMLFLLEVSRMYVKCRCNIIFYGFGNSILEQVIQELDYMMASGLIPLNELNAFAEKLQQFNTSSEEYQRAYQYDYSCNQNGIEELADRSEETEEYRNLKRFNFKKNLTKKKQYECASENFRQIGLPDSDPEKFKMLPDKKSKGIWFQLLVEGNLYGEMSSYSCFRFKLDYLPFIRLKVNALQLKIALNAYNHDHGELPEKLEALIPDYINEIPVDPFDGKPLKYRLEPDPIIYSIGFDFDDDEGAGEYISFDPGNRKMPGEGDMVFPVFAGGE